MQNIENLFDKLLETITLTENQQADARTKYNNVLDCLTHHFYDRHNNDGDQFLFGSYKTKTNIAPLDNGSDVDVLFKIDQKTYEKYKNNPSGLLQEIRKALMDRFTTSEKPRAWGKVVLIEFANGYHNVEVLPALETDSSFLIPNTENGGSWEYFNPKKQIEDFLNSKNTDLVRAITKLTKCWVRNTSTLSIKSYLILEHAINFVNSVYPNGKIEDYDVIIKDFFNYLSNRNDMTDVKNHIDTAKGRAVRAYEHRQSGRYILASQEWQKVFGSSFPLAKEDNISENLETKHCNSAPKPWYLL